VWRVWRGSPEGGQPYRLRLVGADGDDAGQDEGAAEGLRGRGYLAQQDPDDPIPRYWEPPVTKHSLISVTKSAALIDRLAVLFLVAALFGATALVGVAVDAYAGSGSSAAPARAVTVGASSCTPASFAAAYTDAGHLVWKDSLPVGGVESDGGNLQPVVTGGVSAFAYNNGVYAVRARDGHQIWHRVFPEAKNTADGDVAGLWQWRGSLIALVGGVSSPAKLVALNAATGTVRWTLKLGGEELLDNVAIASDGVLVAETASGTLEAASLSTGRPLWSRAYGQSVGPIAVGDVIVASKYVGPLAAPTRTYAAFAAATGKPLWSRAGFPDSVTAVAAPGGRLLLYDPAQVLTPKDLKPKPYPVIALSAATGKQLWTLTTPKLVDAVWAGSSWALIATGLQGEVLVADPTARLDLVSLATGKLKWSAGGTHTDPYAAPLISATDVVFVQTTPATGTVIDREVSTGAQRWKAVISDAYGRFLLRPSGPNVLVTFPGATSAKPPVLLAVNAVTGKTAATADLTEAVQVPPAVTGGDVDLQLNRLCETAVLTPGGD
jgi:outer membrane protein assembly factor BamB